MRAHTGFGGLSGAPATAAGYRAPARPRTAPATGRASMPWSFKLLLVFLVALYSHVAMVFPALEPYAPAQTVAIAGLAALAVERMLARRPVAVVWPTSHLLVVFLGVAALSSFTALWPRHAAEETLQLLKFVAVYFLIVNTVETWRRLRVAVGVTSLVGAFPALGALDNVRTGDLAEGGRAAWIGTYANPNDLAYTLVVLFPLAVALALDTRGWRRLALFALAALYAAIVFLTYSRGGLVAFGAVLLLCFLRWNRSWLRVPAAALAGVAVAAVVATYWTREQGFSDLLADATLQQRVETIQVGLAMFADNPLLGVGPGCSVIGWPIYAPAGTATGGWLHTHNTFIQVLGETGFLGTVVFVLLMGGALWTAYALAERWRRAGRREWREKGRLISALEISMWGFLVSGLAAGLLLTWFPYLVLGYVSAARRLSRAHGGSFRANRP